jgi:hypothetical protein
VAPQGATGARGGWVSSSSGLYDCLQTTGTAENCLKPTPPDSVENGQKRTSSETATSATFISLGFRRLASPVNDRFAFQRSTRASFRFFPRGFRACPHLLDTVEEQIAAVFLVKRHRIVVT